MTIKIAVTGGPSGGKTSLLDTLKRELGNQIAIVPEAASILYKGGFPRHQDPEAIRCAQRAIYYTQFELEELMARKAPGRPLICDRGSLDGAAYWPAGLPDFFTAVNSSESHEINRYHWILHLDTASAQTYDTENVIRTESYKEAILLNEKIKTSWRLHPQRLIIPQQQDFLSKITTSLHLIRKILSGAKMEEVELLLHALLAAHPAVEDESCLRLEQLR